MTGRDFAPFGDAAPLIFISLGAGVQSSAMLLMAARGELEPMPHAAIFADTQWEPVAVYRHLEWLESEVGHIIPIRRVTRGNIRASYVGLRDGTKKRYVQLPFFVKNPDGSKGMSRRQCTQEFKMDVLRQERRRIMASAGIKPTPACVKQWIGISLDEAHRMKDSGVRYIENVYPLVDRRMKRWDCIRWLEKNGYPIPPKSACIGCPYHGDDYWRDMRDNRPDEWADAVDFDRAVRKGGSRGELIGENYLHRSLVPLDRVDFRTAEDRGQLAMFADDRAFGNECEGMCGV